MQCGYKNLIMIGIQHVIILNLDLVQVFLNISFLFFVVLFLRLKAKQANAKCLNISCRNDIKEVDITEVATSASRTTNSTHHPICNPFLF